MATFLKSKVETSDVLTALSFQEGDPTGWEKLSAKALGLSGGTKTFFENSVYPGTGLEVYRKTNDPDTFVLKFAALSFDGIEAVFGTYLGNPPKSNTRYADDYAEIYAAVGKLAKGGEITATGFSLGGLAVNQLADRKNAEFNDADVVYISFGSEYVSSSREKLVNFGAYNDWFFGAYNAYAKLYKAGDAGLDEIANFAGTVFASDMSLEEIPSNSFLKKFFSFDRTSVAFANSVEWAFHFGPVIDSSFVRENYFRSHDPEVMADAARLSLNSPFSDELSLRTTTIFDFDDSKNAVLDVTSHLQEFPGKPKAVYTIGSDGAGDVINGSNLNDRIAGMAGDDTLKGGKGDDQLDGGSGRDKLTGGAGADAFQFSDKLSTGRNRDTITDFKAGERDRIELDNDLFANKLKAGPAGRLAIEQFGSPSKASSDNRILYDKTKGDLYFDIDGSGTVGADPILFAHLDADAMGKFAALGAANFLVV